MLNLILWILAICLIAIVLAATVAFCYWVWKFVQRKLDGVSKSE